MNNNEGMFGAQPKRIRMPVCDKVTVTECSDDFTLPDYQPEIRRLLHISASVLPPAKYIGGNNAEFNGTLDYQVLYVGSDGALYSVPLSAEYNFSCPLDAGSDFDINEGVLVFADMNAENVTSRVSAPRKLTIRCRLRSHVRGYGVMYLPEKLNGNVNPMTLQRLDGECSPAVFMRGTGEVLDVSDEIIPDSPDTRVICAEARVFVTDAEAAEGNVNCRGDVMLKIMSCLEGEESQPQLTYRRIPFSQSVELEGEMTPDCECRAFGHVSNIAVNVGDGKIICDVSIILEAEAQKSVPFGYTKDIFSTENSCECAYKEYRVPVALKCRNGNFSQNDRLDRATLALPENAVIIDTSATAAAENFEYDADKGKITVSGQCRYTLLLSDSGEYSTSEIQTPFRYELDATGNIQPAVSDADIEVVSCRARFDADSLCIDSEISVALSVSGEEAVNVLSEARFGEPLKRSRSDIIICYPSPDDTVWSVAKRYCVPVTSVSSTDETGKDYLIIN